MFREDVLSIIPSILIAFYQSQLLWKKLPPPSDGEIEIAGNYGLRERLILRLIQYLCYSVFWYQVFFPLFQVPINQTEQLVLKGLGYILVLIGFFISLAALKKLKNNWTGMYFYRIKKGQTLETKGIYSLVRHPIYLAIILEIIGFELIVGSWLVFLFFAGSLIVFYKQSLKEDQLLEKKFKQSFRAYKKKTKAFIPFVY